MPKAFSDKEKEIIRDELIKKGEEYFSRYGLKKTNISDLCEEVGIAKGSFYIFFESKESLFFTILQNFESKIREDFFLSFQNGKKSSPEILKDFMKKIVRNIESTPFFKLLINKDEYRQFSRKLSKEQFSSLFDSDVNFVGEIVKNVHMKELTEEEMKYRVSLMRSVFALVLQKEIVGEEYYLKVIDTYIDKAVDEFFKE